MQSEGLFAHAPLHVFREQSKAQSLVAAMSDEIVGDLQKQGLQAQRLPAAAVLPQQGWLVRGVFSEVDDGNRLRRAVVGFGAGQTDLQVAVAVDRLSTAQSPLPLYEVGTDATSGKSPGALVTLNPYVAAAKFVLSGIDLNRNTAESAAKIADAIVGHVKSAP